MAGVKEFFDGLENRADASKIAGMTNSYLFDIEGAGKWTVKVEDGSVNVTEGGERRRRRHHHFRGDVREDHQR